MSNALWKLLLLRSTVLGAAIRSVASAIAIPTSATTTASSPVADTAKYLDQVVRYSKEGTNTQDDKIGQVTSVSQLGDVQPTDWAFLALQSLVERYGVIAGYPDGTFRGNRALTR